MIKDALNTVRTRKQLAEAKALNDYNIALAVPEFVKAEKEERRAAYDSAVAETENAGKDVLKEINVRSEKARADKQKILTQLGLNPVPVYFCKLCGDTGYSNGKLCGCVKKELSSLIGKKFGLSGNNEISFDRCDFSVFKNNESLARDIFMKFQKSFCVKFPATPKVNIILSGNAGTGKTFLSACIASDISLKGYNVLMMTAFALNNLFIKIHSSPIEERLETLDLILDCDLLLIDDLGSEPIYNNVTIEYLYTLINERNLKNKHSIFSTNLSSKMLQKRYGSRIWSRLNNKATSVFIDFPFDDVRLQLAADKN